MTTIPLTVFTYLADSLTRGGYTMIPLLVCSVLALAFIVERGIALRRRSVICRGGERLINEFRGAGDIATASSGLANLNSPLANVARVALRNADLSKSENVESVTLAGRQEAVALERGLVILEIVAVISPLLGLLGTVLGMVDVFSQITDEGIQTSLLAPGIAKALITTVVGLIIAIPAHAAYSYYSKRADGLIFELEKFAQVLVSKIYSDRVEVAANGKEAEAWNFTRRPDESR